MPTATATHQIKKMRRELCECGVNDPLELLAAALVRNEELQAQVDALQSLIRQR